MFKIVRDWLSQEGPEMTMVGRLIKIIIIMILVKILIQVTFVVIENFFKREQATKIRMEKRKADTLSGIIKSVSKYIIYFIGLVIVLEIMGIRTGSILATAGVGGLAIGFGAQSLVKDIITGFFILFEDYFSVGDYIKVKEYDGIVEELGVRSTRIRAFSGELFIIPNGYIDIVTNKSRGDMRTWIDVRINYREDIDRAIVALNTVAENMQDDKKISYGPTVLGVTDLAKEDVVLSIQAMTKPMEQWDVGYRLRKEVKEEFERQQIPISDCRRILVENDEDR